MMRSLVFLLLTVLLVRPIRTDGQSKPIRNIQGKQRLSLQQILDSIDVHNPALQKFGLQTQYTYAKAAAAKAWSAPTVGLGVSEFPYGREQEMNRIMMPRKMWMLSIRQMFPNFSMQKREQAYYQSFKNQNKDSRATLKNELFARAKMAYYNIFISQKKRSILNEQQKQLQWFIKLAKNRLSYDKTRLSNIYRSQARLSDLQTLKIQLVSRSKEAITELNRLIDRPLDAPLLIDTSFDISQNSFSILKMDTAYIRNNRSDIIHTSDRIHSMRLKQKMASEKARPAFGISWENMRMQGDRYAYNAMVTMTIPIAPWSSREYQSEIQAIDYQIQALQKMKESQILEALGQIRKDWIRLQAAKKELKVFNDKVIPAYTRTFHASLDAFSENTGDIYETLMAWSDLTKKRLEYYDKLRNVLAIKILLEKEIQK